MYKWKAEWGRNDNFIMVFKTSEDLLNVKEEFFLLQQRSSSSDMCGRQSGVHRWHAELALW